MNGILRLVTRPDLFADTPDTSEREPDERALAELLASARHDDARDDGDAFAQRVAFSLPPRRPRRRRELVLVASAVPAGLAAAVASVSLASPFGATVMVALMMTAAVAVWGALASDRA